MEKNFDLKDAIRSGVNPEQMLADFQKQLAQAQQEVAMEQAAATDELDEVRTDMVDAIVDYMVAMGFIENDDDTDKIADELETAIKEAEKELAAVKPFLDMLRQMKADAEKENGGDRNPDAVIGEFLKSLI